jgi:palmitoyl-protein thioesterase
MSLLIFLLYIFNFAQSVQSVQLQTNENKPIVLLHGIESTAANLEELKDWIGMNWDRLVYNIELGDGSDYSTATPIYSQIKELRNTLSQIEELKNGFDFIGISQGGVIGRGYVQEYNNIEEFKVHTLITLVSPHGGVFDKSLGFINFYTKKMQSSLSFSNYWRNPNEIVMYLLHSAFLADANNEKPAKNELYKQNLISLDNLVLVYSPLDEIIKPPISGVFGLYDRNLTPIDIIHTQLYQEDWIGLKKLNEDTRLHFRQTNCTHVEHRMPICFPQLYPIFNEFI